VPEPLDIDPAHKRTALRQKSYFLQMLTLTPTEPLFLFIVLSSLVKSISAAGPKLDWMTFALIAVITPIYAGMLRRPLRLSIVIMLSFVAWVFAIGGPFATLFWYKPLYGGVALIVFMSVAPIVYQYLAEGLIKHRFGTG